MSPVSPPCRRSSDQSRWGQVRAWWREWGLLVQAIWLFIVTAILAVAVISYAIDQRNASRTARASCERSMAFGPALADAYEAFHILTPDQLEKYRETLPTSCP